MPSSWTASLRFELQATGENLNTWGAKLNASGLALIDYSIAGRANFTLSGSKTLSTANGSADEARAAILDITSGSGGTVTIPNLSKTYDVRNATAGDVVITAGGASTVTAPTGQIVRVFCDGSNVYLVRASDFGGSRITNVGAPVSNLDAATKKYVDDTAFATMAGSFPAMPGNAGKFLTNDGALTASWAVVHGSDIVGLTLANITDYQLATVADIWAGTSGTKVVPPSVLAAAQAPQTVADASPLVIDCNAGINFEVLLTSVVGATRQLQFTHEKPGWAGTISFKQPASGGPCALTKDTDVFAPGGAIALSGAANAIDEVGYICRSAYTSVFPARAMS